jgi:hypothetical protein
MAKLIAIAVGVLGLVLGIVLPFMGFAPLGSVTSPLGTAVATGAVFWAVGTILGFGLGLWLAVLRRWPETRLYCAIAALGVGAFFFVVAIPQVRRDELLRADGVTTVGTVVGT